MNPGERDLRLAFPDERDKCRREVAGVISALETSNIDRFCTAIENLSEARAWRAAFLAIRRWTGYLSIDFRRGMSGVWGLHGWIIRRGLNDDLLLADALRKLFAPYTGPSLELFRGESFRNRTRRNYGPSWTSSLEVAREFAVTQAQEHSGGGVVLRASVPASAIIADVHSDDPESGEFEYLVARRGLAGILVEVLERKPHSPRPAIDFSMLKPGVHVRL